MLQYDTCELIMWNKWVPVLNMDLPLWIQTDRVYPMEARPEHNEQMHTQIGKNRKWKETKQSVY